MPGTLAKYVASPKTLGEGEEVLLRVNDQGALVTAATITSGSGATDLGKAEDAVHTSGDIGIFALGVATNGTTALAAAGDYIAQGTDTAGNSRVVGNVASGVADAGDPVKMGGVANSSPPSAVTDGQRVNGWLSHNGATMIGAVQFTGIDSVANTNLQGFAVANGAAALRPLATAPVVFNGTTWDRVKKPNSTARVVSSAASTNAGFAKAAAGDLFKIIGHSTRATICYVKIYNKASAPTVGTDTPVLTIPVPPLTPFDIAFDSMYFATGIAYAITTGSADADTGAVAAGDIVGLNIVYI